MGNELQNQALGLNNLTITAQMLFLKYQNIHLNIDQVADALGVARRTLYNHGRKNSKRDTVFKTLPWLETSRKRLCHLSDLAEWIDRQRAGDIMKGKRKRGRKSKSEILAAQGVPVPA